MASAVAEVVVGTSASREKDRCVAALYVAEAAKTVIAVICSLTGAGGLPIPPDPIINQVQAATFAAHRSHFCRCALYNDRW